uniref:Testis cDNA, clone: QtsA-17263, similar to human hypothetical protein FLJ20509 (FLJ20509) n=1 Tax=Macaca fascicularis TaxID=9541 RepID=Q4R6S2_MACFA|nr:unnamed protein product [Macaca fascicularis]
MEPPSEGVTGLWDSTWALMCRKSLLATQRARALLAVFCAPFFLLGFSHNRALYNLGVRFLQRR